MKKIVKSEKGAAVVNDKEAVAITGTWKPSELQNLISEIREIRETEEDEIIQDLPYYPR